MSHARERSEPLPHPAAEWCWPRPQAPGPPLWREPRLPGRKAPHFWGPCDLSGVFSCPRGSVSVAGRPPALTGLGAVIHLRDPYQHLLPKQLHVVPFKCMEPKLCLILPPFLLTSLCLTVSITCLFVCSHFYLFLADNSQSLPHREALHLPLSLSTILFLFRGPKKKKKWTKLFFSLLKRLFFPF